MPHRISVTALLRRAGQHLLEGLVALGTATYYPMASPVAKHLEWEEPPPKTAPPDGPSGGHAELTEEERAAWNELVRRAAKP